MGSGGSLTLWPPSYEAGASGLFLKIDTVHLDQIHWAAFDYPFRNDQPGLSLMVELSNANRAISIG